MTREEFIEILDEKGYSYKIEGDNVVVTRGGRYGHVWLGSLETLPPGVEFKHGGGVNLSSLKTLPPGVEFNNGGWVHLSSLKTLPPGVVFKNEGMVHLRSLQTLPPGVEFENSGTVCLPSIVEDYFQNWPGNIEGVDNKRLLNVMIKQGVFI